MSTSLVKFLGLSIVAFSLLSSTSWGDFATLSCTSKGYHGIPILIDIPDEAVTKFKLRDRPDVEKEFAKELKDAQKNKKPKNEKHPKELDGRTKIEQLTGCIVTSSETPIHSTDCTHAYGCGYNAGLTGGGAQDRPGLHGNFGVRLDLKNADVDNEKDFINQVSSAFESTKAKAEQFPDRVNNCDSFSQCWDKGWGDGNAYKKPRTVAAQQPPPPAAAPAPVQTQNNFSLPSVDSSCSRFDYDHWPAGGKEELCSLAKECANKTFAATCNCESPSSCMHSYTQFCNGAQGACNVGSSFVATSAVPARSDITITPDLNKAIDNAKVALAKFKADLKSSNSDIMGCGLYYFVNKHASTQVTCDPKAPYKVSFNKLESWLNNPQGAHVSGRAAYYQGVYNTLGYESPEDFFQLSNTTLTPELRADYETVVASGKALAANGFFNVITQPRSGTQTSTQAVANNGYVDPADVMARLKNGGTEVGCLITPPTSDSDKHIYLDSLIADKKRVEHLSDWIDYRCQGKRPPGANGPFVPHKTAR